MSCMVSVALQAAMSTTQLVRAESSENVNFWNTERTPEPKQPLSMSWVVVTDENGKRQLRMKWTVQPRR